MNRKQQGFTLIELLVVIAIIGILSSVVLASLNSARQKSRDARRISDIKQIALALELFFDDNASYATVTTLATIAPTYIAAVPTDPTTNAVYTYQMLTNAGAACVADSCPDYVLGADLEDDAHSALQGDIDGTIASIDCDDNATGPDYCVRP